MYSTEVAHIRLQMGKSARYLRDRGAGRSSHKTSAHFPWFNLPRKFAALLPLIDIPAHSSFEIIAARPNRRTNSHQRVSGNRLEVTFSNLREPVVRCHILDAPISPTSCVGVSEENKSNRHILYALRLTDRVLATT